MSALQRPLFRQAGGPTDPFAPVPLPPPPREDPSDQRKRAECDARGGVWDGENCVMLWEDQCPAGMTFNPATGTCEGCPAPETLIKLKDGDTTAGELKVGDLVHTQHEDTLEWGDWPVTGVQIIENQPRLKLGFCDDSNEEQEIVCSWSHKFHVDGKEWVKAEDMKLGDVVNGRALHGVRWWSDGDVVKITVDEAHTYVAAGLLSHNKSLEPCPRGQHREYVEGEGWLCVPETAPAQVCPAGSFRAGQALPPGAPPAWCFDGVVEEPPLQICPLGSPKEGAPVPPGASPEWCFGGVEEPPKEPPEIECARMGGVFDPQTFSCLPPMPPQICPAGSFRAGEPIPPGVPPEEFCMEPRPVDPYAAEKAACAEQGGVFEPLSKYTRLQAKDSYR